eukprot:ANDGO_00875.mRNA.1 Methyltransferase-like protein
MEGADRVELGGNTAPRDRRGWRYKNKNREYAFFENTGWTEKPNVKMVDFHTCDFPFEEAKEAFLAEFPYWPSVRPAEVREQPPVGAELNVESAWNNLYLHHEHGGYFPPKSYLFKAFPELLALEDETREPSVLVDIGSGPGASLYPVITTVSSKHAFVMTDFSAQALAIARTNEGCKGRNVSFVQFDPTKSDASIEFRGMNSNFADILLCVFMLSATPPSSTDVVLNHFANVVKTGGYIFFRDFAAFDMIQARYERKGGRICWTEELSLDTGYYAKGDGITVRFFSVDEVVNMFRRHGFECIECVYHCNRQNNRANGIRMDRVMVNGRFRKMQAD